MPVAATTKMSANAAKVLPKKDTGAKTQTRQSAGPIPIGDTRRPEMARVPTSTQPAPAGSAKAEPTQRHSVEQQGHIATKVDGAKTESQSASVPAFSQVLHAEKLLALAEAAQPRPIAASAMAKELAQYVQEGQQRVVLRIDPPNLGQLDIKIRMNGNEVSFIVRSDSPAALNEIAQQVHELRSTLKEQGLELGDVDVGEHGDSGDNAQEQSQSSKDGEAPRHGQPRAAPRHRSSTSQIDVVA